MSIRIIPLLFVLVSLSSSVKSDVIHLAFEGSFRPGTAAERSTLGNSIRYEGEVLINSRATPIYTNQDFSFNDAAYSWDILSLKVGSGSWFWDNTNRSSLTTVGLIVEDRFPGGRNHDSMYLTSNGYYAPAYLKLKGKTYRMYFDIGATTNDNNAISGTDAGKAILFPSDVLPIKVAGLVLEDVGSPNGLTYYLSDASINIFLYGGGQIFYSRFPLGDPYGSESLGFDFCRPNGDYEDKIHLGTDINTPYATPSVYPVCNGEVVYNTTNDPPSGSNYNDYYNRVLVIKHQCGGDTVFGIYGHMISGIENGPVSVNEPIGSIRPAYNIDGSPRPSANHLHFGLNKKLVKHGWGYAEAGSSCSKLEKKGWIDAPEYFEW